MLLKLLRKTIIRYMDAAGIGDQLQNTFLHALGLRQKKESCVVLTPYFGNNTPIGTERHETKNSTLNSTELDTEKHVLTEGEYNLLVDIERNASSIFNKPKKLNRKNTQTRFLIKMICVLFWV
jgi:hypothetical protein